MEPNKKKNMWMWVLAGVLVVVAIVLFAFNKKSKDASVMEGLNTEVSTNTDTEVPSENTEPNTTTTKKPSTTANLTYQQALEKYKDRRIQFDTTCTAVPNNITYKDNTGIMLDNRSPETRTIKVDTTYTIKGYGFRIITLPDIYLKSKTILVDCGTKQNVATILVQE